MGEVYRAKDTTLDWDVAIKVLPDAFASDPDRLPRFEREAKVLSSFNHSNSGHICWHLAIDTATTQEGTDGSREMK